MEKLAIIAPIVVVVVILLDMSYVKAPPDQAAEAAKFARTQEAEGIQAVGLAEAEAVRAKALAEAEGILKKTEAMQKYGEAAVVEMIIKALPEIAKNVAEPLSKVDKITMFGERNSAKLLEDIVNGTTQVTEGLTAGMAWISGP